MLSRIRKILRDERGSQLLEYILTFPLLWVLIVFSFDQFTILYNKQRALTTAYEAGRIAAVQPNYGLAKYHGRLRGEQELEEAIGLSHHEINIFPRGGKWRKGHHLESEVTIRFHLLASGKLYELNESYFMMIENAEEAK